MAQKERSKRIKAWVLALIIIANIIVLALVAWGINALFKKPSTPPIGADNPDNPNTPSNPDPPTKKDPIITLNDAVVTAGKFFHPLNGVTATDANGLDITERVQVEGVVNTSKVGQYNLTYSVTDDFARTSTRQRVVTVVANEYLGKTEPTYIYTTDEPYNIAKGCRAYSDSVLGNATASKAVDGDITSRWESEHGSNNADEYYPVHFTVDLGAELPIEKIVICWEAAYATDFSLWISSDDDDYTSVDSVSGITLSGDHVYVVELTASARYVRLCCERRATGYGYSIYEFQVFGKQGTVIPSEQYPVLFDAREYGSADWEIVDEQWLLVDFGATRQIDYMEISWTDWLTPIKYDVEVSVDGERYTVARLNGNYLVDGVISARYVRVNMHSRKFYMNA